MMSEAQAVMGLFSGPQTGEMHASTASAGDVYVSVPLGECVFRRAEALQVVTSGANVQELNLAGEVVN